MFTFTTPVRFADVDHAGIVYYPRFFHFFHVAFEELWRARIGARARTATCSIASASGFPRCSAECEFSAPLRFGDDAEIQLIDLAARAKSITFRYRIFRDRGRANAARRRLAWSARSSISRGSSPCPIPADPEILPT